MTSVLFIFRIIWNITKTVIIIFLFVTCASVPSLPCNILQRRVYTHTRHLDRHIFARNVVR